MSPLRRILYVEDSSTDALIMRECFTQAHIACEIDIADDGVEALAMLRREAPYARAPRPDLILLDLNLPRMNGTEVLREIRATEEFRHIPVIVLTTSKAEEDVQRAYRFGANSFITKPADIERSMEMVRTLAAFWFGIATLPR